MVDCKPNQLYAQGMRFFEQYDKICKYFTKGKQRDNDANEIQKHLQLYGLSLGEYLVNPIWYGGVESTPPGSFLLITLKRLNGFE